MVPVCSSVVAVQNKHNQRTKLAFVIPPLVDLTSTYDEFARPLQCRGRPVPNRMAGVKTKLSL